MVEIGKQPDLATMGSGRKYVMTNNITVSISVVSHGQMALIGKLLADLITHCHLSVEVILTLNTEEEVPTELERGAFPITIIRNTAPKGFGANHNFAFGVARGQYFCVVNPDIRFSDDVFARIISGLQSAPSAGVMAPLVFNRAGAMEDSARRFPSLVTPLLRILGLSRGLDYPEPKSQFEPDWVAGMFMVFPAVAYRAIGGFDERYFLYYEDVDLCARLKLAGYHVVVESSAVVVHDARRDSRRKSKYFQWHLRSAIRFFLSSVYWRLLLKSYMRNNQTRR